MASLLSFIVSLFFLLRVILTPDKGVSIEFAIWSEYNLSLAGIGLFLRKWFEVVAIIIWALVSLLVALISANKTDII